MTLDSATRLTKFIILESHLILLGLDPAPKYLLFPPIPASLLTVLPTEPLEIFLGSQIHITIPRTIPLEAELHHLCDRAQEGGQSLLATGTGMKRSPGTEGLKAGEEGGLHRQWSFEMQPRANTEPRREIIPPREPPHHDPPAPPPEEPTPRTSQDSVSFVREILQSSPESPPDDPPPPRRDLSPTRRPKPFRQYPQDSLSPTILLPTPTKDLYTLPPPPSIPPPPIPPSPRSISPSRSVPVQLHDLPHFPNTPTKTEGGVPMLPVLEFGPSPLGMRIFLNRSTSPRRLSAQTPLSGTEAGSPVSKDRIGRSKSPLNGDPLVVARHPSPVATRHIESPIPPRISPVQTPLGTPSLGRVSPSPTVCTFPPRTMRADLLESERTRSVDDLRRRSSPRQGALSRLEHHRPDSGSSGSLEDEPFPSMGRFVSAPVVVYFWKRGGWHRPEILTQWGEQSVITVDPARARGGRVQMRIGGLEGGTGIVHEITPTASIRRDSPLEVSIGCDVPSSKREYLMFATADPGEADVLFSALNQARSLVGGISEEQLRQVTSLFARTTSFASSLATNSSVGSTISNLSLYDTPPLPSIPAHFSLEEPLSPLHERTLVKEHKVKIFLRLDAGIWKNLGNGRVWVFTTGPEVRVLVVQPTKKDPGCVLVDGRIFESRACERVGRTGVAVNLPSREGKISVYMLQVYFPQLGGGYLMVVE
jgi:hypothetical protein